VKKKAVKICRTCGEMICREEAGLWPGCDYVRETPGRVLLCFLYLRVELAHNCRKVRSRIYNPPSLFDIPFLYSQKSISTVRTEPVSPHNNFSNLVRNHAFPTKIRLTHARQCIKQRFETKATELETTFVPNMKMGQQTAKHFVVWYWGDR